MKTLPILLFVLLLSGCHSNRDAICLIPRPQQVTCSRGSFDLQNGIRIAPPDSLLLPAAAYLAEVFAQSGIAVQSTADDANCRLYVDTAHAPQAYSLDITAREIVLRAGSCEGIISGVATLRQLLWQNKAALPAQTIDDAPRYAWRGVMIDVARHFFTEGELRMLIDRMALYKFNKLHLHLTDDQGWRLEIKNIPILTERGAWREMNAQDSLCLAKAAAEENANYQLPDDRMKTQQGARLYGGYYTQDQMRDLIRYAAVRGIEIIPEIDFPGHSLAAIAAIPALSCNGEGAWGSDFSTPLCLGNDSTLEFCRTVLTEVFALFPSSYVHIGGDEVDRTAWSTCPKCRQRIEREKLSGVEALQPWFTRQLEAFCNAHGKKMIGWDEIADDGITQGTTIQWWRSWMPTTLSQSLQDGHAVILSPSEFLYLNGDQDRNSLSKIYQWDPVSEQFQHCSALLSGIQANLWTEQVPSIEVAGERLFPRLLAVAEVAWSAPDTKSFSDFSARLPIHLHELECAGWNYRLADVGGICDANVFIDSLMVNLSVPDGATLYYTLDGSLPNRNALRYAAPVRINADCTLALRCYSGRGVATDVRTATFRRMAYLLPCSDVGSLQKGLLARRYDFSGKSCSEIDKSPLMTNFTVDRIAIPEGVAGNIGLIFDGYIDIPADGVYSFYTYSDDGSVLRIDDRPVVDNDGEHPRTERSGQIALRRGIHQFSVRYFDSNGGVLEVGRIDAQGNRIPIASKMLKH